MSLAKGMNKAIMEETIEKARVIFNAHGIHQTRLEDFARRWKQRYKVTKSVLESQVDGLGKKADIKTENLSRAHIKDASSSVLFEGLPTPIRPPPGGFLPTPPTTTEVKSEAPAPQLLTPSGNPPIKTEPTTATTGGEDKATGGDDDLFGSDGDDDGDGWGSDGSDGWGEEGEDKKGAAPVSKRTPAVASSVGDNGSAPKDVFDEEFSSEDEKETRGDKEGTIYIGSTDDDEEEDSYGRTGLDKEAPPVTPNTVHAILLDNKKWSKKGLVSLGAGVACINGVEYVFSSADCRFDLP